MKYNIHIVQEKKIRHIYSVFFFRFQQTDGQIENKYKPYGTEINVAKLFSYLCFS